MQLVSRYLRNSAFILYNPFIFRYARRDIVLYSES